jgi:hypothetical protein
VKSQVINFGTNLIQKPFLGGQLEPKNSIETAQNDTSPTLQVRLKHSIESFQPIPLRVPETGDGIKEEFDCFDSNHINSPLLKKLNDALMSAQLTTTQSKRNFSVAESVSTKKRSQMKTLKFLKSIS